MPPEWTGKHADVTATIRNEIANIKPFDALEQTHITNTLQWIDSGTNIFRLEPPDKPPKHLVAYFVLVDPEHQSLLLGDHIKAQRWLPPGGHVALDEHPKDTVIREVEEELHTKAVFLRNDEHPFFIAIIQTVGLTPGHTDVDLWYCLRGDIHDHFTYDKREFNDIDWFSFNEILQFDPVIFDAQMQRFTRKLMLQLKPHG
jgi:8-oxo-dGTP diphosphatase